MTKLPTMQEHKDALIADALRLSDGKAEDAALLIGMSVSAIYKWKAKKACAVKNQGA